MINKDALETLYRYFTRREMVHPDPLEVAYRFQKTEDREITALIAASLAYGRVDQILKSIDLVLSKMVPTPSEFLQHISLPALRNSYSSFKHRFTAGGEIADLLFGMKRINQEYGSLHRCFLDGLAKHDSDIFQALCAFSRALTREFTRTHSTLIPKPERGSACKRMHLFLRWMVRRDSVDPGGWNGIPPSKLIVPLDTHMHTISRLLGFTNRRDASFRTAREITDAFRTVSPDDPVRYDFALTRLGIRKEIGIDTFLKYHNKITDNLC